MKLYLIIMALLIKQSQSNNLPYCQCSQHSFQSTCYRNQICSWSTQNEYCNEQSNPCTQFKSRALCDTIDGCAWTNNSTCAPFTSCSNYNIEISTKSEQCYQKDDSCVPGTQNPDQSVTCKKGSVICSNVIDLDICGGLVQSDGQWCAPLNYRCVAQDISRCSTITHSDLCVILGCNWYVNRYQCVAPTCSDYTVESDCQFVRADQLGYAQLCAWCEGKCTESLAIQIQSDHACYFRAYDGYHFSQEISYYGDQANCTQILSNYNYFLTFMLVLNYLLGS